MTNPKKRHIILIMDRSGSIGDDPEFLVKDLATEYEPARDLPPVEPEQAANRFAELVRAATQPKET